MKKLNEPAKPKKLTAQTVAGLKLDGASDKIFWDTEIKGFGFRLRREKSRLSRTWVVQYRVKATGLSRRSTIGDAEKVTAEQARAEAKVQSHPGRLGRQPHRCRTCPCRWH